MTGAVGGDTTDTAYSACVGAVAARPPAAPLFSGTLPYDQPCAPRRRDAPTAVEEAGRITTIEYMAVACARGCWIGNVTRQEEEELAALPSSGKNCTEENRPLPVSCGDVPSAKSYRKVRDRALLRAHLAMRSRRLTAAGAALGATVDTRTW